MNISRMRKHTTRREEICSQGEAETERDSTIQTENTRIETENTMIYRETQGDRDRQKETYRE